MKQVILLLLRTDPSQLTLLLNILVMTKSWFQICSAWPKSPRQILDMVEFGIKQYKSLQDFKSEKISAFVKPVIVYKWKITEELRRIRRLLLVPH